MRAQIIARRLLGLLFVSGLIALLIGSSFAQAPPQQSTEQRADDIENMRDDMLRRMGPYTPRELYPSLMQLPDLSPEKQAEIERLARQRMEDGLQIVTESRAALTAATENNDLSRMGQAAADMRAGVGPARDDEIRFGDALAVGDFQNDVIDDLVIGVPGAAGGHVTVLYGSRLRLTAAGSQVFRQEQGTQFRDNENESGDQFGQALVTGDFENDLADDLVVGIPLEDRSRQDAPTLIDTGAIIFRAGVAYMATVDAASFREPTAPDAIVSVFGEDLASGVGQPSETPLPEELLGTSVEVTDSAGVTRLSKLFFVSRKQVNLLLPPETALGVATVNVRKTPSPRGFWRGHKIKVAAISPGIFTASATGQGVAAGLVLRVKPGGEQTFDPLFDAATGSPVPIDMVGIPLDEVFLLLFGTGIRGFNSEVTATLDGKPVTVLGAAKQSEFAGLDQVNLGPVPRDFAGAGGGQAALYDIDLLVDGQATNTVQVSIR